MKAISERSLDLGQFPLAIYRFLGMGILIGSFLLHHLVLRVLIWNDQKLLKKYVAGISNYCRLVRNLLNINVTYTNPSSSTPEPTLVIANHMSYIDIIVLAERYP